MYGVQTCETHGVPTRRSTKSKWSCRAEFGLRPTPFLFHSKPRISFPHVSAAGYFRRPETRGQSLTLHGHSLYTTILPPPLSLA